MLNRNFVCNVNGISRYYLFNETDGISWNDVSVTIQSEMVRLTKIDLFQVMSSYSWEVSGNATLCTHGTTLYGTKYVRELKRCFINRLIT